MVRLYQKFFLIFCAFSLITAQSTAAEEKKSFFSKVTTFAQENAFPLSMLAGTIISGCGLFGTQNFFSFLGNLTKNSCYYGYKGLEKLGPEKTIGLTSAALVGTGLKHSFVLAKIQNELTDACMSRPEDDQKFRLFGLQSNLVDEYFQTGKNKDKIKIMLKGLKIDYSKTIKAEQNVIKNYIRSVGQLTDLPCSFNAEVLEPLKGLSVSVPEASEPDKAIFAIEKLFDYQIPHTKFLSEQPTGHRGSSLCYVSQWRFWNPFGITFVPNIDKATEVCKELFAAYARLCALEKIAHEIDGDKKKDAKTLKNQLLENADVSIRGNLHQILEK